MNLLRKCSDYQSIKACIRLYSLGRKSHYDVLKLRKNCSDKDIKEAFIRMSKEYHPDKNKDAKAQEKFVRIVEAYNVLGKPSSRAHYDSMREISTVSAPYVYRTHVTYNSSFRNNPYYSAYYESATNQAYSYGSAKEKETPNDSYYGFAGIKKLPNYYIIGICFGIATAAVMLQFFIIRNMYAIQRSKAQEKSKRLAEELDRVRTAARDKGNELQSRLLLERIVAAANPTVATASLGQSLAKEEK